MILYYAPGACSLADHIALHEAGLAFDRVRVDLKTHLTEDGRDYREVNPKGYVPALQLADGSVLTENIAILSWIADQAPQLAPGGELGRYRLLETLAFISTEIHKAFKPLFTPGTSEAEKATAGEAISARFDRIAGQVEDPWVFGSRFTVADAYLYVMVLWARNNALRIPRRLTDLHARMNERAAVQLALKHEGLA